MREGLRMALTLLIIGALSGGLLSVVNGVTNPIISERAIAEFQEALERFFPDLEKAETEEMNGEVYSICYDEDDNLIGVVGQVKARGYGGDIFYDLAVNDAGDIIGIRISKHEESPGIGDVIGKEQFQNRVLGLNVNDPISIGVDVDTVTGASVSTTGMFISIRRVMDVIGENFLVM